MAAEHARRLGHLPRARDPRRAAVLDARTAGCITPQSAPHLHTFHITPSHPQAAALSTYDASYYSLLTASYLDASYYSLLTASYLPLQAFSAYDASAVRACIVELHSLYRKAASATLRAVFDKYATPDVLAVSSLTPPETLPLVLDNSA